MEGELIRRLAMLDAAAFLRFRQSYLAEEPLAFGASPEADFLGSESAVRAQLERGEDSAIFGAFAPGLVGAIGVYREPGRPKTAHKMHVWGAYVAPEHRRRGIGRRLLQVAVEHARSAPDVTILHLSVTGAAPTARRLYESAGFEAWGTEPDALRHAGRSVEEHHLFLRLRE